MKRSVLVIISCVLLGALVAVGGALAAKAVTPKQGVFGSPTTSVCLAASTSPKKCKGKINVFKAPTGKLVGLVGQLKTGCRFLDDTYVASVPTTPVKNGRLSYTGKPTNYQGTNGKIVVLRASVTATFTAPKVAAVDYQVKLVSGKVPTCSASALAKKSITLNWFAAKDNGG